MANRTNRPKIILYKIVGRKIVGNIAKKNRHLVVNRGSITLPTGWIGKNVKVILLNERKRK